MERAMTEKERIQFKADLDDGERYQDFIMQFFWETRGILINNYASRAYQLKIGEGIQGYEIKLDRKIKNNLYIEHHERKSTGHDYILGGIYRDNNTIIHIQGDYKRCYMFMRNTLITLHKDGNFEEIVTEISKGFLLPISVAEKYGQYFKCKRNELPNAKENQTTNAHAQVG